MTWEEELFRFFDDLEQQAEAMFDAARDLELADRSRTEYHQVTLASRLMASVGLEVALELRGVGAVGGTLERVGTGWCLVRGAAQDWVLPLAAVTLVHHAAERSVPEIAWSPVSRLGLASALRRLAEAGERCVLHLVDGAQHEAVLHRVGADFVEARVGEGRGSERTVLVAFEGIAAVQSREEPAVER